MIDNKNSSDINWNNKSILIVEDDKFNAYIIESFLKNTHVITQVAGSGELAIELAQSMKPDLILMDIKLPSINGMEATQRIRTFLPNVIIIAQTAYATEGDRDEALKAGCNDFISKPIKGEKLLSTISKYI